MSSETRETAKIADLLTKACGDIAVALILAGKEEKIGEWIAPYMQALNEFDAANEEGATA